VFPFTYLRGFLGPQDMPYPQYGLPPWPMPYLHTRYRFALGLSNDMVGYIFPEGNGVGVPGEHVQQNPTGMNDTDRFGCGHSDDSESASSSAGNLLGTALVGLLRAHYGASEPVTEGRYVLPDGTLSRNPLGTTDSVKCSVDKVFVASNGPAVAVWLPGGRVIHPDRWLSLSGRPQLRPDRNTRGYIVAGVHHWLDVFPDIAKAPKRVTL
jgi:hypothetical protein